MTRPAPTDGDLAGFTVLVLADLDFGIGPALAAAVARLSDRGAKVAVLSGLGDPRGDINPVLSLGPMAEPLSAACGRPVAFIRDCVGTVAEAGLGALRPGAVALMENTRFHRGEIQGEQSFANRLALLGDFFLDARSRPLAGIAASARLLPDMMTPLATGGIGPARAIHGQGSI